MLNLSRLCPAMLQNIFSHLIRFPERLELFPGLGRGVGMVISMEGIDVFYL